MIWFEYEKPTAYDPHPVDAETRGLLAVLAIAAGPAILIVAIVLALLSLAL